MHKNNIITIITKTPENKIVHYVEYSDNWLINAMKKEDFKCRWAYISDLLPKEYKKNL